MNFRTAYNYVPEDDDFESNYLPSLTVPDQSLSVRELFARSRSLLSDDVYHEGFYEFENDDDGNFDALSAADDPAADIVDVQEEARELARRRASEKRASKLSPQSDDLEKVVEETKSGNGEGTKRSDVTT